MGRQQGLQKPFSKPWVSRFEQKPVIGERGNGGAAAMAYAIRGTLRCYFIRTALVVAAAMACAYAARCGAISYAPL